MPLHNVSVLTSSDNVGAEPLWTDDYDPNSTDIRAECYVVNMLEGGSAPLLDSAIDLGDDWKVAITFQSESTRWRHMFSSLAVRTWVVASAGGAEFRAARTGVTIHFATLADSGIYTLRLYSRDQQFVRCFSVSVLASVDAPTLEVVSLERHPSAMCTVVVACSVRATSGATPRVVGVDSPNILQRSKMVTTPTHVRHVASTQIYAATNLGVAVQCVALGATGSGLTQSVNLGKLCAEATYSTLLDSMSVRELHPEVQCRPVAAELSFATQRMMQLKYNNEQLSKRPAICPQCTATLVPRVCPVIPPPNNDAMTQFIGAVITTLLLIILFVAVFVVAYILYMDTSSFAPSIGLPPTGPPMIPLSDVAHLIPPAPIVHPPPPPYTPSDNGSDNGSDGVGSDLPPPLPVQPCPPASARAETCVRPRARSTSHARPVPPARPAPPRTQACPRTAAPMQGYNSPHPLDDIFEPR